MSWAIAASAAISVVSGVLGSKSKKKAAKREAKQRLELIEAEKQQSLKDIEFQAGLEDYYQQLDKRDKYLGMQNYSTYNDVGTCAPDYVSTYTGPQVPEMPGA